MTSAHLYNKNEKHMDTNRTNKHKIVQKSKIYRMTNNDLLTKLEQEMINEGMFMETEFIQ